MSHSKSSVGSKATVYQQLQRACDPSLNLAATLGAVLSGVLTPEDALTLQDALVLQTDVASGVNAPINIASYMEFLGGDASTHQPSLMEMVTIRLHEAAFRMELPPNVQVLCNKSGRWRVHALQDTSGQRIILGAYNAGGNNQKHCAAAHILFLEKKLECPAVQGWLAACQDRLTSNADTKVAKGAGSGTTTSGVKRASVDIDTWLPEKAEEEAALTSVQEKVEFYADVLAQASCVRSVPESAESLLQHALQCMAQQNIYFTRDGLVFQHCPDGFRLVWHRLRIGSNTPFSVKIRPRPLWEMYRNQVRGREAKDDASSALKRSMQGMLLSHKPHDHKTYGQCPSIMQDMIRTGYCRALASANDSERMAILTTLHDANASLTWLHEDNCAEIAHTISKIVNNPKAKEMAQYWVDILLKRYLSGKVDGGHWISGVAAIAPDSFLMAAAQLRDTSSEALIIELFALGASAPYDAEHHDALLEWCLDPLRANQVHSRLSSGEAKSVMAKFIAAYETEPEAGIVASKTKECQEHKAMLTKQKKKKKKKNRKKNRKKNKSRRDESPDKCLFELLRLQDALAECMTNKGKQCGLKEVAQALNAQKSIWFSPVQIQAMRNIVKQACHLLVPAKAIDAELMWPLLCPKDNKGQPVMSLLALLVANSEDIEFKEIVDAKRRAEHASVPREGASASADASSASVAIADASGNGVVAATSDLASSSFIVDYLMLIDAFGKKCKIDIVAQLLQCGVSPATEGHGFFNAVQVAVRLQSQQVQVLEKLKKQQSRKGGSKKQQSRKGGSKKQHHASSMVPDLVAMLMQSAAGKIDLTIVSDPKKPGEITNPFLIALSMPTIDRDVVDVLQAYLPLGTIFKHPVSGAEMTPFDLAPTKGVRKMLNDQGSTGSKFTLQSGGAAAERLMQYATTDSIQKRIIPIYLFMAEQMKMLLDTGQDYSSSAQSDEIEAVAVLAQIQWNALKEGVNHGTVSPNVIHATAWMSLVTCAVVMSDHAFLEKLLLAGAACDVRVVFCSLTDEGVIGDKWSELIEAPTPLHIAALLGEINCLQVLLTHGAEGLPAKHDLFPADYLMLRAYAIGYARGAKEGVKPATFSKADIVGTVSKFATAWPNQCLALCGAGQLSQTAWGPLQPDNERLYKDLRRARVIMQVPKFFAPEVQALSESLLQLRASAALPRFDTRVMEQLCTTLYQVKFNAAQIAALERQQTQHGGQIQLSKMGQGVRAIRRAAKAIQRTAGRAAKETQSAAEPVRIRPFPKACLQSSVVLRARELKAQIMNFERKNEALHRREAQLQDQLKAFKK